MSQLDYTYTFNSLNETLGCVHVIDHSADKSQTFQVAVDDSPLLLKRHHRMPTHLADCVDLAVAVAIADRLSRRQADMPCAIHIVLPVRHPELFESSRIVKRLQEVLYWYTGDHWSFAFPRRSAYGRPTEMQMYMSFTTTLDQPIAVSLWSGGLDSLAGVYRSLLEETSIHHILIGTSLNPFVHSTQQHVEENVRKLFPGRTALVQVPIRLNDTKKLPKNALQRSRGFVFLLLGAVCAVLEGQGALSVYENGIGAINLPYRASEVGLDHSRSVHPVSLLRMGDLVSQVLGTPFVFRNPFLFQTKAQMCAVLATSSPTHLIALTFTCDRPHRERPMQCGYCSSCLLRRQALAVLGIEDRTPYTVTTHLYSRARRSSYGDHLRAMLCQVASLRFILSTADPWYHLSEQYPTLSEIVDEMIEWEKMERALLVEQLIHLYRCYIFEWESVQRTIGQGLLEDEKG